MLRLDDKKHFLTAKLLEMRSVTLRKCIFCITGLLLFNASHANIFRVYYFGTPVSGVDYPTPQAAHDAATAGDTIQIYPTTTTNLSSGFAVFATKPLVWVGIGYFLGTGGNPGLQVSTSFIFMYQFTLNPGSDGTILEGLTFYSSLYFNSNNNVVRRCNFNAVPVVFQGSTTGNSIIQNYFTSSYITNNNALINIANVNISNNFFYSTAVTFSGVTSSGQLVNNIFSSSINIGTFLVQNNIQLDPASPITCASCVIQNNLSTGTAFGNTNGNQENVPAASLFTGTGSTDGQWQLAAGSPARGAGVGGTDCGIFGGTTPYVLSGIPSIPSIYTLTSSGGTTVPGPTMPITISTRGNN
jgi:hypothetical protein